MLYTVAATREVCPPDVVSRRVSPALTKVGDGGATEATKPSIRLTDPNVPSVDVMTSVTSEAVESTILLIDTASVVLEVITLCGMNPHSSNRPRNGALIHVFDPDDEPTVGLLT